MQIIEKHTFKPAQKAFDFVDAYLLLRQLSVHPPRPIGRLQIFVANSDKELVLVKNPSGYLIFFGDVQQPNGVIRQRLYDGSISLRVKGQFYQEEVIAVNLASPDNNVPLLNPRLHLQPNYAYPFPNIPFDSSLTILRGHVATAAGNKVEGVGVAAVYNNHPLQYTQTDKTGQWLFMVPPEAVSETLTPITITLQKGPRQETIERTITLAKGKNTGLEPLVWPEN